MKRKVKFRITEGVDILRARDALGLSQKGLAKRCKKKNGGTFTQRWVSWLERPDPHIIKPETIKILEKALA